MHLLRSVIAGGGWPIALVLGLAAAPRTTLAQDLNYDTFLVGERAIGLGGAYTAVADDPSATYYNPAGLALRGGSHLSGSLSITAYQNYALRDGYVSPGGSASLTWESFPSLPLFFGVSASFGDRDATRHPQHAVGLSTLVPSQLHRAYRLTLMDRATGDLGSVR